MGGRQSKKNNQYQQLHAQCQQLRNESDSMHLHFKKELDEIKSTCLDLSNFEKQLSNTCKDLELYSKRLIAEIQFALNKDPNYNNNNKDPNYNNNPDPSSNDLYLEITNAFDYKLKVENLPIQQIKGLYDMILKQMVILYLDTNMDNLLKYDKFIAEYWKYYHKNVANRIRDNTK
jgi:hypothetical protein